MFAFFPCHFNHLFPFHLDFKQFLEDEKAVWSRKLEEIEKQFLSSEKEQQLPSVPPPKKTRKRKGGQKADQNKEENLKWQGLQPCFRFHIFNRYCMT